MEDPKLVETALRQYLKQREANLRSYYKHKEEISAKRKEKYRLAHPDAKPRGRPRKVVQPPPEGEGVEGASIVA